MKVAVLVVALGLAVAPVLAEENAWPERGDVVYIPAMFNAPVSNHDLISQPIPYDRLNCIYTNQCHYQVFSCDPLDVTSFMKKPRKNLDLVFVNIVPGAYDKKRKGVFASPEIGVPFVLGGSWRESIYRSKEECLLEVQTWSKSHELKWEYPVMEIIQLHPLEQ